MTIQTQMELITERLIKGELTQEEALKQQRELLGAPIETTTEVPVPAPTLSTQTRCESAIAKYEAIKADCRERLQEVAQKAQGIGAELSRIENAISAAESKSRILAGSPAAYQSEKARLLAAGLMGEAVDLTALETEAKEFSDSISAGDLALGIKTLRLQVQEVQRRKIGLEAERRRITHEYLTAQARVSGIKFALLSSELADQYAALQACHRAALSHGDRFSTLAPDALSNLQINNPLPDEIMREVGITRREWSGRAIEQTNAINIASGMLFAEMGGAA